MKKILFMCAMLLLMPKLSYGADQIKAHTWADGETPTAALWNANEDALYSTINDIEGENLASDIAITTSGNCVFNGTLTAGSTLGVATSAGPDSADGATLGTASLEWSDLYIADGGVVYFGLDQEIPLTHVADTGLQMSLDDKLMFGDTAVYIFSDDDGHLDLTADITIDINGVLLATDKIIFTQIGGNEYIDSLADGYLDLGATTAIRNKAISIFENAIYLTQTDGAEKIDSDADGDIDYTAGTSHDFIIGVTEQITLIDGALAPTMDNDIDLGAVASEFKDLYITGTANIDALVADTVDINGGTVDGANIGAVSAGAGAFTTLTASGNTTLNANATIGDAPADSLHVNANTITFEGTTADANDTTFSFTAQTAARTVTFPDSSGTILFTNAVYTNTAQPAFLVNPTVTQTDIAEGSQVTVVWGTEVFDQGSDFAANTFTAPVTGKYQLNVVLQLVAIDTAADYYYIYIVTSNRSYLFDLDSSLDFSADAYAGVGFSMLCDMDAADTATITIYQEASGVVQTDVTSSSYWSGFLAC